ncbi:MAG: hypothetical protein O6766_06800, partial [Gammaproteobacteria bacterium]|nr:hypothetical protein [Gammaproteobacteria bacterium]
MLRTALAFIAGLLSVALSEIFSITWMTVAPANLDLTANYFMSVVVPAVLLVHLSITLIFWKALAPNPGRNCGFFIGTHAIGQGVALFLLNNPPADIASYVAIILLSG